MSAESLPLFHLMRPPETNDVDVTKPPLLILLHGVRSNEQDLFALNPYLDERFIVISVRAPIAMGPNQFGWYHVTFYPDHIDHNVDELEQSRQLLLRFIAESVTKYGANPERVYLMGFSQGSIMSLTVMLTRPELLAGVVIQSGSLPTEILPIAATPAQLKGFSVMVVHGLYDDVLSIKEGRTIREYLDKVPVNLEYHEYPMRHQISDQSLDDVCGWLITQLNRA